MKLLIGFSKSLKSKYVLTVKMAKFNPLKYVAYSSKVAHIVDPILLTTDLSMHG